MIAMASGQKAQRAACRSGGGAPMEDEPVEPPDRARLRRRLEALRAGWRQAILAINFYAGEASIKK